MLNVSVKEKYNQPVKATALTIKYSKNSHVPVIVKSMARAVNTIARTVKRLTNLECPISAELNFNKGLHQQRDFFLQMIKNHFLALILLKDTCVIPR